MLPKFGVQLSINYTTPDSFSRAKTWGAPTPGPVPRADARQHHCPPWGAPPPPFDFSG